MNAQSLLAHKDEIIANIVCFCYSPSIIILSETRTIPDMEDSELNIGDYSLIRCDAESRRTGSVCVYTGRCKYLRNSPIPCVEKRGYNKIDN